jgi:hypothetical protein
MRPIRAVLLLAIVIYVVSVVAALGGFSGRGTPVASAYEYQYTGQVTICHKTGNKKKPRQTIVVNAASLDTFLAQGDTLGPCP